jgi:hypothetical protein
MAVKVALIKSLLSKYHMLPSFCLCLCVRVCFVCPVAYDYVNSGLWAVQMLEIKLVLSSSLKQTM